jgi:hypothetical protein
MKVSGTGFLSEDGKTKALKIRTELSSILKLSYEAAMQCHETLVSMQPLILGQDTENDKQKIIASVLQVRLLEIAESAIYLAQGGFSVEICSAYRNFLEAYFIFGNVCEDAAFVAKYFNSDLKVREKLINVSQSSNSEIFEPVKQYASDQVRNELRAEIERLSASDTNTFTYAKNIGCEDIYNSQYRISSAATHSTPRSLADYVIEDSEQNVIELKRHPQADGVEQRLLDIAWFLTKVNSAYLNIFDASPTHEHKKLIEELTSFEKWKG